MVDKVPGQLPYVPVYDLVTEPVQYTFFDTSSVVKELYIDEGGVLDIERFISDLEQIIDRYKKFEELEKNGAHYTNLGEREESSDAILASQILRKIRAAGPGTEGIDMLSGLQFVIGGELYYRLKVMLEIRKDEKLFLGRGAPFDGMKTALARYGVNPQTVASLKKRIGSDYFGRLEKLFVKTAAVGMYEGRTEDVVKFVVDIITYGDDGNLYSISKRFKPVFQNPDYFPSCGDVTLPTHPIEKIQTEAGYQIYCGLREFLEKDVKGEHSPHQAILNNTKETATFQITLPDEIKVLEGATQVFEGVFSTNVIGAEFSEAFQFDVPKGAEGKMFFKYDHDGNRLTIKAVNIENDHEQYKVGIRPSFTVTNLDVQHPLYRPELSDDSTVALVNENEPPRLVVKGPSHIFEGNIFCMDAEVVDPEGDPTELSWKQVEGPSATLVEHEDAKRVCARADATHQVEKPFHFKVAAVDSVERWPWLSAMTTEKEIEVFNLPSISMGQDIINLPPEVIVALTDPKGDPMSAVALANETSLYIFLRLPEPLDRYAYDIMAPIANTLNLDGCAGNVTARKWAQFKRVPSDGNILAYYTESKIGEWIQLGKYSFRRGGSKVSLEHMEKPIWATIPVKGEIEIKDGARAVKISAGIGDRISDSVIRIPLKISNAVQKEEEVLQLKEELPVTVKISGSSRVGNVVLSTTVTAKRQNIEEGGNALYYIDIPLPESYTIENSDMDLYLSVQNRLGEEAQLRIKRKLHSRTASIFNDLDISLPPNYIALFPWYMIYLNAGRKLQKYMPYLAQGKHDFTLASRGGGSKVQLASERSWTKHEPESLMVKIPAGVFGHYSQSLVRSLKGNDGKISGLSSFLLPVDISQPDLVDPWKADITWSRALEVSSYFPKYPQAPELVKKEEEPEKDINPLYAIGGLFYLLKKALEISMEALGNMLKYGDGDVKPAGITPVGESAKAGETFYLNLFVPSKEGIYDLKEVYYADGDTPRELSRTFTVEFVDRLGNSYATGAQKAERVDQNNYRFAFEVPTILLSGEHTATVRIRRPISANFVVSYSSPEDTEKKIYTKETFVEVFKGGAVIDLRGLKIIGAEDKELMEGQGGVKRDKVEKKD